MGTAISGSGPAYVFLLTEAMIDSAVHLGFSRAVAEKLVLSTIKVCWLLFNKIAAKFTSLIYVLESTYLGFGVSCEISFDV